MQIRHGIDLSHWNTITSLPTVLKANDFVILKASEGPSNKDRDPTYKGRSIAISGKRPLGAYHFARGTNVNVEANNFLNTIGSDILQIIALDVETVFPDTVNWCLRWMTIIEERTGIVPHLYINLSYLKRYVWDKLAAKYPLWLAAYRTVIPDDVRPWPRVSIWQRTSTGVTPGVVGNVDLNVMYMEDKNMAQTTNGNIEVRDAWNLPVDKKLSPQDYDAKLFNYVSTIGRDVQTIKETLLKLSK